MGATCGADHYLPGRPRRSAVRRWVAAVLFVPLARWRRAPFPTDEELLFKFVLTALNLQAGLTRRATVAARPPPPEVCTLTDAIDGNEGALAALWVAFGPAVRERWVGVEGYLVDKDIIDPTGGGDGGGPPPPSSDGWDVEEGHPAGEVGRGAPAGAGGGADPEALLAGAAAAAGGAAAGGRGAGAGAANGGARLPPGQG